MTSKLTRRFRSIVSSDKPVSLVLAFVLAVSVFLAVAHRGNRIAGLPHEDPLVYCQSAISMLTHHTYPQLWFAPGYSAFLAVIFALVGKSLFAVYLIQAFMLTVTVWLVHKIALHITGSRSVALITIVICAVWPPFYGTVPFVFSENLAGLLIAVSLWYMLLIIDRPSIGIAAVTGVLVGLASLTKAPFLAYAFVAAFYVAFVPKHRATALRSAAVMLLMAGLVVIPWTIRNYELTGKFVPICNSGPFNFWISNDPLYFNRVYGDIPIDNLPAGVPRSQRESYFCRQGFDSIAHHPLRASEQFVVKFGQLWLADFGSNPKTIPGGALSIGKCAIPKLSWLAIPLFLLAIVGWYVMPAEVRRRAGPVLALMILWTIVHVLLITQRRYVVPIWFYEIMFAGFAIDHFARLYVHRRETAKTQ